MKYFHFIEFLKGKKVVYLIIVDILIVCILFIFIFLLGVAFNLKKKNFYNTLFSDVLKFIIPLLTMHFFGQIFNALLSANKCENHLVFYDLSQKCNEGILFYFQKTLAIIAIICLCIMSMFVVSIYYVPIFTKGNSCLKKTSSIPEQVFFVNKVAIILLFYIEDCLKETDRNINDWLMIILLFIFSGINAYISVIYKNIENQIILLINNIFSLLLFWGFCSLLIGMIFKHIGYSGTSYLYIIGTILIILYNIYYENFYQNIYWKNINYMYSNQERLNYIIRCINIVEKRNESRKNKIILKSMIEKVELYCINPQCTIKQYLLQLKKGIDSSILLYDHCEDIFKLNIVKNKNDITAKIYYILFIMIKLNRIRKAQILLKKLEDRQLILFQDLFNIYRAKQLLEETSYESGYNENDFYYSDMLSISQYKNYIKDFNNLLFKTSSLYLQFWTLLLNSHNQIEKLENLNNIGKEIKDLIAVIDDTFNKIYNYRNDIKIIKLYVSFIKKILVDKKYYKKYYKFLMNNTLDFKKLTKEDDHYNYDINKLKENDDNQWILISAEEKNCGTILNLSLGVCPIIGYKKREIIGSNINTLIPNIFHKPHEHMLHKLLHNTRNEFYESLSKKEEYKQEEITKIVYCKNKAKYLVPFPFKAFFVQTEEGEHIFVMNIIKQKCFPHTKNKKNEKPLCCVLTDNHFIIQTFTPNAQDFLGLTSQDIDSGINITSCITHHGNNIFNNGQEKDSPLDINEIFNYSSDLNYETSKILYSTNTINEKNFKNEFLLPQIITWNYNDNVIKSNTLKLYSRISSGKYEIRINKEDSINEKKLMLHIDEAKINNNIIGYHFFFRKLESEKKEPHMLIHNVKSNPIEQSELMESEFSDISNLNNNLLNSPTQTIKSIHKDSIKKYDSSLNVYTNDNKPSVSSKRRNSQGNCHQKININNFAFSFKIDKNFLPLNKCNFILDINSMSFIYYDKVKNQNNDSLLNNLFIKAKEKMSLLKFTETQNNNNSNSHNN